MKYFSIAVKIQLIPLIFNFLMLLTVETAVAETVFKIYRMKVLFERDSPFLNKKLHS